MTDELYPGNIGRITCSQWDCLANAWLIVYSKIAGERIVIGQEECLFYWSVFLDKVSLTDLALTMSHKV